jgi:LPXTG-site transpeptidase (sortase) family protein
MFAFVLALLLFAPLPPPVHAAKPTRLEIPSIAVDAPVLQLGLKEDGAMESPQGPGPVGWYDFSPTPGNPGNAVFSGHRDWHTGVVGVFWRLNELSPGDRVAVVLEDGQRVVYAVKLSVVIPPEGMPIEEIVGPTPDETITLITCEGSFDSTSKDYDKRRVVWATRVVS